MLLANPGLKSTGWKVCEIKLISREATTTTTTTSETTVTTTATPGPQTTTKTATLEPSTFTILSVNNFFHSHTLTIFDQ